MTDSFFRSLDFAAIAKDMRSGSEISPEVK
jgi:hypothetical protein